MNMRRNILVRPKNIFFILVCYCIKQLLSHDIRVILQFLIVLYDESNKLNQNEQKIRGWINLDWVRVEFIPNLSEINSSNKQDHPTTKHSNNAKKPFYGFRF